MCCLSPFPITQCPAGCTNPLLEYRKVTRLGIEPRPSGHIPNALTTELSSLVGFNHTINFMYLPPQIMVTSHPQRTTKSTIDHQSQPNDDSATTTWVRLNSSDRLHNPSSTLFCSFFETQGPCPRHDTRARKYRQFQNQVFSQWCSSQLAARFIVPSASVATAQLRCLSR